MMREPLSCALCGNTAEVYAEDSLREYRRCPACDLIFVPTGSHPTLDEEKVRYDKHRNDPGDAGYRAYLDRLVRPMLERLRPGMRGLDYGCGPGPAIPLMFEEAGIVMSAFDPFYANDPSILEARYDFVTCTEVVEHFRDPCTEWKRLAGLVRHGGFLGIMTQLVPCDDPGAFTRWHYRNDHTHLCFYSRETFQWLANELDFGVEHIDETAIIMRKL